MLWDFLSANSIEGQCSGQILGQTGKLGGRRPWSVWGEGSFLHFKGTAFSSLWSHHSKEDWLQDDLVLSQVSVENNPIYVPLYEAIILYMRFQYNEVN